MDETFTETYDDMEHKAGRRHKATHKVELMAVVTNIASGSVVSTKHVGLDLNDGNLGTLTDATDPFFEAGTKMAAKAPSGAAKKSGGRKSTGGGSKAKAAGAAPTTGEAALNKAARTWVQENRPDLKVSDRGRLANEALDAYKAEGNPNWERDFMMDEADDSAPAAPVQTEAPVSTQAPAQGGQNVDEHGWEREPDSTYAGTYG